MPKFNETLNEIKERANMYLDFKRKNKLTQDNHNNTFWRNRRLLNTSSWNDAIKLFKLKQLLTFMPEKLVNDPLNLKNSYKGEFNAEYDEWLWDYQDYLIIQCGESNEGLWEKISVQF